MEITKDYWAYLESIRHELPDHVKEYVLNEEHYNLTSHSSLHDAWLESLTIREPATGDRQQHRSIEIDTSFLGPFHDRHMYFFYKAVQSFDLQTPAEFKNPPSTVGHGDLLVHQFRLEENRVLIHEMEFSRGSKFIIKCQDFIYKEEAICLTF